MKVRLYIKKCNPHYIKRIVSRQASNKANLNVLTFLFFFVYDSLKDKKSFYRIKRMLKKSDFYKCNDAKNLTNCIYDLPTGKKYNYELLSNMVHLAFDYIECCERTTKFIEMDIREDVSKIETEFADRLGKLKKFLVALRKLDNTTNDVVVFINRLCEKRVKLK